MIEGSMIENLNNISLEEFLSIENYFPTEPFNDIIIVPTNTIHESGFRCMKFVLVRFGKIVGAVSGWSDVIHFNGIGGYGHTSYEKKGYGYKIDCLAESRCIRIMTDRELEIDDWIGSDFIFYVGDSIFKKKEKPNE